MGCEGIRPLKECGEEGKEKREMEGTTFSDDKHC